MKTLLILLFPIAALGQGLNLTQVPVMEQMPLLHSPTPPQGRIYSTAASMEILDSVNNETPKLHIDSVAYYANWSKVYYNYKCTAQYAKFTLEIYILQGDDPLKVRALTGKTEIVLHPSVEYAIIERFTALLRSR